MSQLDPDSGSSGVRAETTAPLFTVARIPAKLVEPLWVHASPWLWFGSRNVGGSALLDQSSISPHEAPYSLLDGSEQLWLVLDDSNTCGGFKTVIHTLDHSRVLAVYDLAGTSLSEWVVEMEAQLVRYGRYQGCTALQLRGTAGLDELAPGYRIVAEYPGYTIYERSL